ncbi:glycerophosphodiester phosphodiesterase, partial [Pseudomonas syringae pv. tagetis]
SLQIALLQGVLVSVWTVIEAALMGWLDDFGADCLITDFRGLATDTLVNR